MQTLPAVRQPHIRNRADSNATLHDLYGPERVPLLAGAEEDIFPPEVSTGISGILTHRVLLAIVNFGFLAFLEISLCAVLPLFLASSSIVGGLGLSPPSIGTVLGGLGLVNGLIQILLFAPAHNFLGTRLLYTFGVAVFAVIYGLMALITQWVKECDGCIGWQSWALLSIIGLLCPIENMAFSMTLVPSALDISLMSSYRLHLPLRQRICQILLCPRCNKRDRADCCVPRARGRSCRRHILICILQPTP